MRQVVRYEDNENLFGILEGWFRGSLKWIMWRNRVIMIIGESGGL